MTMKNDWRDLPPTEKQLAVFRRWGRMSRFGPHSLDELPKTRGEASDMITLGVQQAKERWEAMAMDDNNEGDDWRDFGCEP